MVLIGKKECNQRLGGLRDKHTNGKEKEATRVTKKKTEGRSVKEGLQKVRTVFRESIDPPF